MKFAPKEIREKAVKAYMEGTATSKQLAKIFGYTVATICNWVRDYKKNNILSPRPGGHRKKCFSDAELKELVALIKAKPDITLEEIRMHFKKDCALNTISVNVRKLGFVYKKNFASQRTGERRYKAKKD